MSMTSTDIRKAFLEFFRSKGHHIVPSAPIVIKNDPTLMFTNAGMNQFKDYFLGNRQSPYKRVADTQKCLRVSGKPLHGVGNYLPGYTRSLKTGCMLPFLKAIHQKACPKMMKLLMNGKNR